MGPATRFLKNEAQTDLFKRATGHSLSSNTMRDRELVNRFCAFHLLGPDQYKGDMDHFLAQALELMNGFKLEKFEKLSSEFRTGLRNNIKVFGKHAFRKHASDQKQRSVINASLWDVMSTGLSHYPESLVESKGEDLRQGLYRLLKDPNFEEAITLGTSQMNRVRKRFEKSHSLFREIFQ
jgi:hypothetical protein